MNINSRRMKAYPAKVQVLISWFGPALSIWVTTAKSLTVICGTMMRVGLGLIGMRETYIVERLVLEEALEHGFGPLLILSTSGGMPL